MPSGGGKLPGEIGGIFGGRTSPAFNRLLCDNVDGDANEEEDAPVTSLLGSSGGEEGRWFSVKLPPSTAGEEAPGNESAAAAAAVTEVDALPPMAL